MARICTWIRITEGQSIKDLFRDLEEMKKKCGENAILEIPVPDEIAFFSELLDQDQARKDWNDEHGDNSATT